MASRPVRILTTDTYSRTQSCSSLGLSPPDSSRPRTGGSVGKWLTMKVFAKKFA